MRSNEAKGSGKTTMLIVRQFVVVTVLVGYNEIVGRYVRKRNNNNNNERW